MGNNVSQYSRLNNWRDVGDSDIKIFLVHWIAMGLVRKGAIEKYWDHGEIVKTPFFGTYVMEIRVNKVFLSHLYPPTHQQCRWELW